MSPGTPAAVHLQFDAALETRVMHIPLTLLTGLVAYFIWASTFAGSVSIG